MSIVEQVRLDMVNAMKSKEAEKVSILRVLIGEFGRIKGRTGKELSDDEALKEIRTMCENAKLMGNDFEEKILGEYLPKMLDDDEIKVIISGIISSNNFSGMKDMGKVMTELKKHPASKQIDNGIASKIVKSLLG